MDQRVKRHPTSVLTHTPIRPDLRLTLGAAVTSDPAVFCQTGYSRFVRQTSGRVKRDVYRAYDVDRRSGRFEIDHMVPLGLGGSDTPENLWPQSLGTAPWNAEVKDRLEWRLKRLVCGGATPARQAQQDIATDWIAAYGKVLPQRRRLPGLPRQLSCGGVASFLA